MENLWNDIRHGVRLLAKDRSVSAISILALSLGIGLTTTMFSIVYGTVLRGLPYHGADRIMYIGQSNLAAGEEFAGIRIRDYQDYVRHQRTFEELGAYYFANLSVSGTERAEQFSGAHVSANTFRILGAQPRLGRLFTATDEGPAAERVVLIGERMWRDRYGGDGAILGKSIRVNGRPAAIVGVLPADFQFPNNQQLWLPLDLDPLALAPGAGAALEVFGRLQAGTSREQALADLTAIAERMARERPVTNKDLRPTIDPFTEVYIGRDAVGLLYTMLGAVFFVLLIACTNVANLLLSRAIVRTREFGIRTALGASRTRIITQLLTEALVLCMAGALIGMLLSVGGIAAFKASLEADRIPFFVDIRIDAAALQFVLALTLVTTLAAAAIPALKASRGDVAGLLISRGGSGFRLGRISRGLVVFEIALSCGLLVAAGLTTRSIVALRRVDLGFDESRLFTGLLILPAESYPDSSLPRFYERLNDQLLQTRGFETFTLSSSLPGLGSMNERIALEGTTYQNAQERPRAAHIGITSSYATTLGVSLVEGRAFTQADRAGAPLVALVNRAFARKYFPDQSALGRRLRLGEAENGQDWLTIVGVMPDLRYDELSAAGDPLEVVFTPLAQRAQSSFFILGRTRGQPLAVTSEVRAAVAAVDRDLPLTWTLSLRNAVEVDTWFFNVFGGVFVVFGLVALALAAVGLYGVMAFSVSQRTREVGIRMAVGAQSSHVRYMILEQGVWQMTIGMAIGLLFAAALSRLLAVILFDVNPNDPIVFVGVIVVLTTSALLASIVPARRATRIHPLEALRHE